MGYSAVAIVGLALSANQQHEAKNTARRSAEEQEKARGEQKAMQAGQAAQERRQQIREERIRRARIIQAGENTGTGGSSGEAGAIGSLATQLGTNLGMNASAIRSSARQSGFLQSAANFDLSTQEHMGNAAMFQQIASFAAPYGKGFTSKPKGPSTVANDPFDTYQYSTTGIAD